MAVRDERVFARAERSLGAFAAIGVAVVAMRDRATRPDIDMRAF
jgi:hypothetical protein